MACRITRNRRLLREVYTGTSATSAVVFDHEPMPGHPSGDYSTSREPVRQWVAHFVEAYERRRRLLDALDHDDVPIVHLNTHTGVFAAAFGCTMHAFPGSPDASRPAVETAAEADALEIPSLESPSIARFFELADLVRERVGPDVPIAGPDYQSPFDIAALVWRKERLFLALRDNPDAVHRLVEKCRALLEAFWHEFRRRVRECSVLHCPSIWAPADLGCALSEDEAGCLSTPMFDEFCLPSLEALSRAFGGMFVHCCADADHQYASFLRIPNLRGINRVFVRGPANAIAAFSGRAPLLIAWHDEAAAEDLLRMARPDTRFVFCMGWRELPDAQRLLDHLRALAAEQAAREPS